MKLTADTNLLVRAVVRDDAKQAETAARLLLEAELIALPLACLCEFVWVLERSYGFSRDDTGRAVRTLVATSKVKTDRDAVHAGLLVLDAGGDFADGVIAHTGQALGADTFVSFDRQVVKVLRRAGVEARTP